MLHIFVRTNHYKNDERPLPQLTWNLGIIWDPLRLLPVERVAQSV